ncbi:MAG: hypothetical protein LBB90_04720 [Tannerella sp.]|jgi:hypothetical protein|nr:hypothetical protein [Tannerella sp.]
MMDVEKLKSVWASVDERLGKQELLKESIIREMIRNRSDKSLHRLINYELHSFVLCLFSIPLMVMLLDIKYFRVHTQWGGKVFVWTMLVVLVASVIWQLIKMTALMKVDFTKDLKTNSICMNKYDIWIKKEKIVGICMTPVLYLLGIWMYAILQVHAFLWIFLACVYLFGMFLMLYLYRVYNRNIHSIRQSLEELKELEEEPEPA